MFGSLVILIALFIISFLCLQVVPTHGVAGGLLVLAFIVGVGAEVLAAALPAPPSDELSPRPRSRDRKRPPR
ncbi:MAG: hypothetical protein AAF533_10940 [Acidobacteriota bacterium]